MVMKKKSKTTAMKEPLDLSCRIMKDQRKHTRTIVVHLADASVLEDLDIDSECSTIEQVTLQREYEATILTFRISEKNEDDDDDFDESEKDEDEELDDHLSKALDDDDHEDGEF